MVALACAAPTPVVAGRDEAPQEPPPAVVLDPAEVEVICCGELGLTEPEALAPNSIVPAIRAVRVDGDRLVIEAMPSSGPDHGVVTVLEFSFRDEPELLAVSAWELTPAVDGAPRAADLLPTRIKLQTWSLQGPMSGRVDSRAGRFGCSYWLSPEQLERLDDQRSAERHPESAATMMGPSRLQSCRRILLGTRSDNGF